MSVTFVDAYARFPQLQGLLVAEATRDWSHLRSVIHAARRSILHPSHVPGVLTAPNHAMFAWVLCQGEHWADAWPHFQWLGGFPAKSSTWEYVTTPEATYARCYETARQAAGA
jgi:hypothetical protein